MRVFRNGNAHPLISLTIFGFLKFCVPPSDRRFRSSPMTVAGVAILASSHWLAWFAAAPGRAAGRLYRPEDLPTMSGEDCLKTCGLNPVDSSHRIGLAQSRSAFALAFVVRAECTAAASQAMSHAPMRDRQTDEGNRWLPNNWRKERLTARRQTNAPAPGNHTPANSRAGLADKQLDARSEKVRPASCLSVDA